MRPKRCVRFRILRRFRKDLILSRFFCVSPSTTSRVTLVDPGTGAPGRPLINVSGTGGRRPGLLDTHFPAGGSLRGNWRIDHAAFSIAPSMPRRRERSASDRDGLPVHTRPSLPGHASPILLRGPRPSAWGSSRRSGHHRRRRNPSPGPGPHAAEAGLSRPGRPRQDDHGTDLMVVLAGGSGLTVSTTCQDVRPGPTVR